MRILAITIPAAALSLLTLAAPATAQVNGWIRDRPAYSAGDYRTLQYDARRVAYDNGYREGLKHGEHAARDRKPMSLEREKVFRNADDGYNRRFGDKERYRETFRTGFAEGYRQAYDRFGYNRGGYNNRGPVVVVPVPRDDRVWNGGYGGYGGGYGGGYANVAFQNGVNDGYQKGLDDARHGKYPDVTRQRWYRSGDRNYEGRYGSRNGYRDQYRAGFQDGYNRAYREAQTYRR